MAGIPWRSSGHLQRNWVTSSVLPSTVHTVVSKVQPSSPWMFLFLAVVPWYWHLIKVFNGNCTDLSLVASSPIAFHQWLSSGTPAFPHSAKPQLLPMTTSWLQNQYHLGDSYTTKFKGNHEIQTWPLLKQLLFVLTEKTLSRRIHFSNAGLLLITISFQL